MTVTAFLLSLRPLLARGKSADALEQIAGFVDARNRWRDPPLTQEEAETLTRARLEIQKTGRLSTS
jgi:hypothetical protein